MEFEHQKHLKKPGRCNVFEYEFKIERGMPPTENSRPIPFALRAPVREHIQRVLRDGILEESYSACQPTYASAPSTETYPHLRGCTKNKQADGSVSCQGTAYAREVTEISRIVTQQHGPQQRISASAAKQRNSEMDRLSIPE